eukprot:TRINITY_DN67025_c7_g4_i1.p1 TRINITY_DN67025_c7_g4~~TRINITY_DN67025_c7_g4_i1.p1  ORF type:complete len:413 (-),score=52.29 TRINITY_DN67025_c7_g4_i1:624-1862(-)
MDLFYLETGALILFYLFLSFRVVGSRVGSKIGLGSSNSKASAKAVETLQRRGRAHGNFSEFVPITVLAFWILYKGNAISYEQLGQMTGSLAVIRFVHFLGITLPMTAFQVIGAFCQYLTLWSIVYLSATTWQEATTVTPAVAMLPVLAGVCGLLVLLSMNCSVTRVRVGTTFGEKVGKEKTDEDPKQIAAQQLLNNAIRAHGNFVEYVPAVLLTLNYLVSVGYFDVQTIYIVGGVTVGARVLQALGIIWNCIPPRAAGTAITFLLLIGLGIVTITNSLQTDKLGCFIGYFDLFLFLLAANVGRVRVSKNLRKPGCEDPTGAGAPLFRVQRIMGNFVEYAVFILLAVQLLVAKGTMAEFGVLVTLGAFAVCRVLHAIGLTISAGTTPPRFLGAVGTFLILGFVGGAMVYAAVV